MGRLVPAALVFYGALALAAWGWRSALAGEPLLYASPEDAASGIGLVRGGLAGLATGAALIALSRVATASSRAGRALAAELARALGPLGGGQIVWLALASGIAEELFFRGALQPRVGLLLASLLFGLAHLLPSWPLVLWSLFAVLAGLAMGALFEATGNLLAPIVAHVLVNGINLRWLVQSRDGR